MQNIIIDLKIGLLCTKRIFPLKMQFRGFWGVLGDPRIIEGLIAARLYEQSLPLF
jgi:hypothetical protein